AAPPQASVQEAAPQTNGTGTEERDQKITQSVKVLSSSGESGGVGELAAVSGDKSDTKRRDTRDISANDVKISDMKMLERARMAAKLQATSRTKFEKASLENRNSCSESRSCSRDVPPLFGVGY